MNLPVQVCWITWLGVEGRWYVNTWGTMWKRGGWILWWLVVDLVTDLTRKPIGIQSSPLLWDSLRVWVGTDGETMTTEGLSWDSICSWGGSVDILVVDRTRKPDGVQSTPLPTGEICRCRTVTSSWYYGWYIVRYPVGLVRGRMTVATFLCFFPREQKKTRVGGENVTLKLWWAENPMNVKYCFIVYYNR